MSNEVKSVDESLKLGKNEYIKVEITLMTDGTIRTKADGINPVDLYNMVGILEAAKVDVLTKTTANQPMVEITIDELDVKLNPESNIKIGTTMPIPESAAKIREEQRKEALKPKMKDEQSN